MSVVPTRALAHALTQHVSPPISSTKSQGASSLSTPTDPILLSLCVNLLAPLRPAAVPRPSYSTFYGKRPDTWASSVGRVQSGTVGFLCFALLSTNYAPPLPFQAPTFHSTTICPRPALRARVRERPAPARRLHAMEGTTNRQSRARRLAKGSRQRPPASKQARPAAKTKYSCRVILSPILPTSVSHLHPSCAHAHTHTHIHMHTHRGQT